MREHGSILSVLMYLFHHHMERENPIDLNDMKLIDELKTAGFHAHIIGKAFCWLHNLVAFADQTVEPSANSFRVFSDEECRVMNEECRHFILSLEQQKILTPHTREIVIHLAFDLIHEGVDLHLLKWVTLMVLFNMPNSEKALSHMEFLVLTNNALDNVH